MNPNVIRRYLSAKTLEELEIKQLKLNKMFSTAFEYTSFYQDKKGLWYTDFMIDVGISQSLLSSMRVKR